MGGRRYEWKGRREGERGGEMRGRGGEIIMRGVGMSGRRGEKVRGEERRS